MIRSLQVENLNRATVIAGLKEEIKALKEAARVEKAKYAKEVNEALLECHTENMNRRIKLNEDQRKVQAKEDELMIMEARMKKTEEYLSAGQAVFTRNVNYIEGEIDINGIVEAEVAMRMAQLELNARENLMARRRELDDKERALNLKEEEAKLRHLAWKETEKAGVKQELRDKTKEELKKEVNDAYGRGYQDGMATGYDEGYEEGRRQGYEMILQYWENWNG
jgi:hypothetical protein